MPTIQNRPKFFETEQGQEIEDRLREMVLDENFNTGDTYTPDAVKYPGNCLTFIEKHKSYLIAHPLLDPLSYVANLRLKTRLSRR